MKNFSYQLTKATMLLCILSLFVYSVNAQAPQKMSYQSIIRDASGALVSGGSVGIKISILQGSAGGTVVYAETHTTTTNVNGLATIEIGGGTLLTDSFSHINWANGPFYIKTETDPSGGTSYTLSATSQLLSVPYALFANNGMRKGNNPGDMLYWNGLEWVIITGGTQGQTLTYCNGVPSWGPCPGLATISVNNVSSTGPNSGTATGFISVGTNITARGICYSTSPNPTTANSTIPNGSGTGGFTCAITGLTPNTLYYVRAYATNSIGTVYSNQESFTTNALNLAAISTKPASLISHTSSRSGGIISNNGGSAITAMGICYATSANPTIANTTVNSGINSGTVNFVSELTNLSPNTTYYIRAFATNSAGTGYGNQETFTTPSVNTIAVLQYPDTVMASGSANGLSYTNVSFLYPTKIIYPHLKKVEGTIGINFSGNNNIVGVDFPVLDTLNGKFYFDNNLGLTVINAPSIKTVKGYVYVRRNTSLQQLNICTINMIYCDGQAPYYSINTNTNLVDSNLACYAAILQSPAITTKPITQFSSNTAIAGGTLTQTCSFGNYAGVCWSTTPNPTVNDPNSSVSVNSATTPVPFTISMTGLTPNTTYYVRAYTSTSPSNSGSISYGNEVTFTTLP